MSLLLYRLLYAITDYCYRVSLVDRIISGVFLIELVGLRVSMFVVRIEEIVEYIGLANLLKKTLPNLVRIPKIQGDFE